MEAAKAQWLQVLVESTAVTAVAEALVLRFHSILNCTYTDEGACRETLWSAAVVAARTRLDLVLIVALIGVDVRPTMVADQGYAWGVTYLWVR